MDRIHLPTAANNLKKSVPLLFSTAAAVLGWINAPARGNRFTRMAAVVIATLIVLGGYHTFKLFDLRIWLSMVTASSHPL